MLEIEHLSLSIPSASGPVTAVSDVTLSLESGHVLGLVGESGCGKSITAQTILRLGEHQGIERTGGTVKLDGQDIFKGVIKGVRLWHLDNTRHEDEYEVCVPWGMASSYSYLMSRYKSLLLSFNTVSKTIYTESRNSIVIPLSL